MSRTCMRIVTFLTFPSYQTDPVIVFFKSMDTLQTGNANSFGIFVIVPICQNKNICGKKDAADGFFLLNPEVESSVLCTSYATCPQRAIKRMTSGGSID